MIKFNVLTNLLRITFSFVMITLSRLYISKQKRRQYNFMYKISCSGIQFKVLEWHTLGKIEYTLNRHFTKYDCGGVATSKGYLRWKNFFCYIIVLNVPWIEFFLFSLFFLKTFRFKIFDVIQDTSEAEAVIQRFSVKQVFSQISLENTCARVFKRLW